MELGPAELAIVLIIVVMIFGASRLTELGGSLGQGIKEFRNAIKEDETGGATAALSANEGSSEIIAAVKCPACSGLNAQGASFCDSCGAALSAPIPQS